MLAELFKFVHSASPSEKPPEGEEDRRLGYYRNAVCGSQGGELALPYRWQWRVEKWKNSLRTFFGGGDQQPRPKICPACNALVGINATRCHECGASMRFSLAALSKKFSGLFGEQETPVTAALLVANILMFGVSLVLTMQSGEAGGLHTLWGMSGAASYQLGASIPFGIMLEQHQLWRLVTAMFLHGGLLHIGFNMMTLMQIGPALEELYGSARYLFLYVVTGALGFVASALTGHFSIGASGALLGLIGAMLAVTTKRGGSFMRDLRSRLIRSLVILFVIGFLGSLGIDNSAHLGGLAVGFGLGKVFEDRQPMNSREKQRAYALGWFAGITILASFVLMILHFHDPLPGR
jgi:rhomboid protease GluP